MHPVDLFVSQSFQRCQHVFFQGHRGIDGGDSEGTALRKRAALRERATLRERESDIERERERH